jgi:hypothetical protein
MAVMMVAMLYAMALDEARVNGDDTVVTAPGRGSNALPRPAARIEVDPQWSDTTSFEVRSFERELAVR